ncbi:uncharacterized protein LOC121399491 isoform X2 [Xenopus laevis]|uniref:Uncharacterized protein LOC121399491 isoform X2 n=1 Tax=Xenopus laevis TaxID=8355 RepID=A0A8J1M3K2_XENLA|nr:uncharacterized protein LOC121399491 isoform X2 [Xenopus laevis]
MAMHGELNISKPQRPGEGGVSDLGETTDLFLSNGTPRGDGVIEAANSGTETVLMPCGRGMVVILSMEVTTIIMSFFLHIGNGITRGYMDGQWDRSFHIGMVIGCRVSILETGRKRRAGCSGGEKERKDKRRRQAHQQGGKKKPIQQIQGCRKRIQAHRDQSWQSLQRRHLWLGRIHIHPGTHAALELLKRSFGGSTSQGLSPLWGLLPL